LASRYHTYILYLNEIREHIIIIKKQEEKKGKDNKDNAALIILILLTNISSMPGYHDSRTKGIR